MSELKPPPKPKPEPRLKTSLRVIELADSVADLTKGVMDLTTVVRDAYVEHKKLRDRVDELERKLAEREGA